MLKLTRLSFNVGYAKKINRTLHQTELLAEASRDANLKNNLQSKSTTTKKDIEDSKLSDDDCHM